MKNFKRILSMILTGSILFLAACGAVGGDGSGAGIGTGNTTGSGPSTGTSALSTQGRFVELDISPPIEGRFTSYLSADGTITCFDEGFTTIFESNDGGESWSQFPGPFFGSENPYYFWFSTLLPDGSILAFDFEKGLLLVTPEGNVEPYPMDDIDTALADGEMVNVSLLQTLGTDRLLMSYTISSGMMFGSRYVEEVQGDEDDTDDTDEDDADDDTDEPTIRQFGMNQSWESKTLLIDLATGEIINDLSIEGVVAATSNDTYLFLMDRDEAVTIFNLQDGSHSGKPDISFAKNNSDGADGMIRMFSGFGGGELLALRSDGAVYSVLDGSLVLAEPDGILETVLDRSAYAIGTPRNVVNAIHVLDDDSIVVNITSNGQSNLLYKYVWDENATVDPNKTLTIWSLEDNSFVRAAIAEMRKKHPDATITYEVALDGAGAMSASDAIRNLNTRLLGGDPPDVIILDGIAIDNYVVRGMMLDLSELLDLSDVYENLLNPFKSDGKLYSLPTQLIIPVLMGTNEALDKVETLDDLVDAILSGTVTQTSLEPGRNPFEATGAGERAELHFDDLQELYEFLWISAAPGIVGNNNLDNDAMRRYLETVKAISDKLGLTDDPGDEGQFSASIALFDGSSSDFLQGSLVQYFMHRTNYAVFMARNLMILRSTMERGDSDVRLFPGFDTGIWQPSTTVGVSADSERPEFAAEFIQTMLSKEVQHLNYGTGLPVTRSGMAAQLEFAREVRTGSDAAFDFDIDSLINQLQTPSISDSILTDMIWGSVERFCKGLIGVDGAVNEIEQNIRTYLAERA